MQPFNARKNSQGFTLIEILTVLLIIGILAAIAAPSYLAMLNKNKVNNALSELRGALQEAQREAIRKSKSCSVTLNTTNNRVTGSCLVTGERVLDGISMRASNSSFKFSYKGVTLNSSNTELSDPIVVVVSHSSNPNFQKCLVMSAPLGLIRADSYSSSDTSGTVEAKCTDS